MRFSSIILGGIVLLNRAHLITCQPEQEEQQHKYGAQQILQDNIPNLSGYIQKDNQEACHEACTALYNALPTITYYYPLSTSPTNLCTFQSSFYASQQSTLTPSCILTPSSETEISDLIRIITAHSCPFTIKSGGHSTIAGASNSDGGIAIDLKLLNQVEFLGMDEEGRERTRVGTGAKWANVYGLLEGTGRIVVGGRVGTVGVGGFLLGGGISYLSRRYSWACDNILSLDLILPNSTFITLSPASHPSLFTAIKGSASSYGIVTSFTLQTYPQRLTWGGNTLHLLSPESISSAFNAPSSPYFSAPRPAPTSILEGLKRRMLGGVVSSICWWGKCTTPAAMSAAFSDMLEKGRGDRGAQVIFAVTWAFEAYVSAVTMVHSIPPPPPPQLPLHSTPTPASPSPSPSPYSTASFSEIEIEAWNKSTWTDVNTQERKSKSEIIPRTFEAFIDLPRLSSTLGVREFAGMYAEQEAFDKYGYAQHWGTLTFHLPSRNTTDVTQPDIVKEIIHIWVQEATALTLGVRDIQPAVHFQPLYPEFLEKGGNALGLRYDENEANEGMLIVFTHAICYTPSTSPSPTDEQTTHKNIQTYNTRVLLRIRTYLASLTPSVYERELNHPFVYMNYAKGGQDVFAGYGPGPGESHSYSNQNDDDGESDVGEEDGDGEIGGKKGKGNGNGKEGVKGKENANKRWRNHLRALRTEVDPKGTWQKLNRAPFQL